MTAAARTGIIIVDHGSRRQASNEMLHVVAEMFRAADPESIIEPAHMELADPDIAQAFDACVAQGATRVIVHPFFLFPGRHWHQDIPQLTAAAAARHEGVDFLVTAPLGNHPLIVKIMQDRIESCRRIAEGESLECPFCNEGEGCQWSSSAEKARSPSL